MLRGKVHHATKNQNQRHPRGNHVTLPFPPCAALYKRIRSSLDKTGHCAGTRLTWQLSSMAPMNQPPLTGTHMDTQESYLLNMTHLNTQASKSEMASTTKLFFIMNNANQRFITTYCHNHLTFGRCNLMLGLRQLHEKLMQ